MNTTLITGAAGFIGSRTSQMLLDQGHHVIAIDNLNNYYDVRIKNYRIEQLKKNKNFFFYKIDIQEKKLLNYFKTKKIDCVINLAAQAGVRHSLKDPYAYINSNILGHLNMLEFVKKKKIKKFI